MSVTMTTHYPHYVVGSLSNDDDAQDDAQSKMNLYFTSEIRDYLDLFGTPTALKICLR